MSRFGNILASGGPYAEELDKYDRIIKDRYGHYTEEEKAIIDEWNKRLGRKDALRITVFKDANFLRAFLKKIPHTEHYKYVENTYKYCHEKECNHEYVIVTRRAVPSKEPKREGFWTTEHSTALVGLLREIPETSPERLHSVIMVSTLGKLEEHGLDTSNGPRSDGEVRIDASKPFNDFLFMYKPEHEKKALSEYLKNGGMTREEVLNNREKQSKERRYNYSRVYNLELEDVQCEENSAGSLREKIVEEMINSAYLNQAGNAPEKKIIEDDPER